MKKVLLFPIEPLKSAVLELLAYRQPLSVNDLHTLLKREYNFDFSKQYIYKIISKMLRCCMVKKWRGKISIDEQWNGLVREVMEHSTGIESAREAANTMYRKLQLEEGSQRKLPCTSFEHLSALWDTLTIPLLEKEQQVFQYLSHAYWVLSRIGELAPFDRTAPRMETQQLTIIGNDSFLDRYSLEQYKHVNTHVRNIRTHTPFAKQKGYNMEVIGDYIIEMTIPERMQRYFEFFFSSVQSMNQFDEKLFRDVMLIQEPMTLIIRRNRIGAQTFKTMIREHLKDTQYPEAQSNVNTVPDISTPVLA